MIQEKITGLDLSLTDTGVAVYQPGEPVHLRRVRPPAKMRGHERLAYLYNGIRLLAWGSSRITVEGPAYGMNNNKTHEMAGEWWIVLHVLWKDNPQAQVVVVQPPTLKKYISGKGSGIEKDAVLAHVIHRYGHVAEVSNNNTADALGLLAMTMDVLGEPFAVVPQVNRSVLDKWPYSSPFV